MKIKKILSQHRRDFTARMECESCGDDRQTIDGYDDAHYHENVIPKLKCEKCGEKAPSDYRALTPKHDDRTVV